MKLRIRYQSMENLTRITIPTYQTAPELPPSPHFDDETTVLTARPVVPIIRRVSLGNGRDYVLTIVILLIAALVGAVSALSIDRFQNALRVETGAANQASLPGPEPVADTPATSETTEAYALPAESSEPTEATTSPRPETKAKIVEKTVPLPSTAKAPVKKNPVRENVVSQRPRREVAPRMDADVRRALDSGQSRPRQAGRISEIFGGPGRY